MKRDTEREGEKLDILGADAVVISTEPYHTLNYCYWFGRQAGVGSRTVSGIVGHRCRQRHVT